MAKQFKLARAPLEDSDHHVHQQNHIIFVRSFVKKSWKQSSYRSL